MRDSKQPVTGHTFRPRARIMLTLGLELISDVTVALAELVKNAYDADANFVLVRVSPASANGLGQVDVLDDGSGMTSGTVTSVWMEPATPSRRRRKRSPSGRRSLGEKGLGRFATAKIAFDTELVTRSRAEREVRLRVDWRDFEDDNRFLDEVSVDWVERTAQVFAPDGLAVDMWAEVQDRYLAEYEGRTPDPSQGTLLRMRGLRFTPQDADLIAIRRSLSRLVTPIPTAHVSDFTVILEVIGSEVYSGVIAPPEELQNPQYALEATVDETGLANVHIKLPGASEPLSSVQHLSGLDGRPPRVGSFSLAILAWDRDSESLEAVAGTTGSADDVRRALDNSAGVSIYRDGFRVLPYGEVGDDWLGLDRRRLNNPSRRLSNNQVIGTVKITGDGNPGLVDQTNREGLVSGPPFEDLRLLVLELLTLLEIQRSKLRKPPSTNRRPYIRITEAPRLDNLRQAAAERHDSQLLELVSDAEEELASRTEQTREVVARYQRLATLGQLVDTMIHEVGQPAAAIRNASAAAAGTITKAERSGISEACKEVLGLVQGDLQIIRRQASAALEILNRLAPFGGRKRGRPRRISVEQAVRDAVGLLEQELRRVDVKLPEGDTGVTVDGTELQEVVINLLRNGAYWVSRSPKSVPRRMLVEVERNSDGSVSLTVSDSGPGVPEDDRDRVFEPYFSTRDGGNGLGLAIAGEIVNEYYGGELELMSPGTLGGASFRATLRRRV